GERSDDARVLRDEIAWREFYADVLHHEPASAWRDLRPLGIEYDDPRDAATLIEAWREGHTGFPIVDAGMRQLASTGWMHNRVRMITASFLTKDLHVWWPVGARHFLDALIDGDLASNNHGWQWVAGTGTDAAPYFRVFNPVTQGLRFDPEGDYVRRWVPELRGLAGRTAHEPWKHGGAPGYPDPVVDHAQERAETLDRYSRRTR
ncbi:MAG: deoxyribodipyrimidine photo-lyase, partial [Myxococcales bacterium]